MTDANPWADWGQHAADVVAALAVPQVQQVLTEAEDLLAPPNLNDVDAEYVRGVVELVVRVAGLTSDDVPAVLVALGYGDNAEQVQEVLYGRAA